MKKSISFFTLLAFVFSGLNIANAETKVKTINASLVAEEKLDEKQVSVNYDMTTNLLEDTSGETLELIEVNGRRYQLDSIDVTRSRQKIEIEYYLGDYNNSELIGVDSGYADYEDYLSDFYLSISEINEKFGTSIPSTYRMVVLSSNPRTVPEIVNPETPIKVQILVAEVLSFSLYAYKYQNKQDVLNPSAIGKTKDEIESFTDYWRVMRLSTSFKGIRGQTIDLKSASQFTDSYKAGTREGNLVEYGYYDEVGNFIEVDKLVISDTLPKSLTSAGFYLVDDYGSSLVKPPESSGMTSGGNVGFTGGSEGWKPSTVKETYDLSTQKDILVNYPFNLDGDPFTNPEFELWYPSENWMLGHQLSIQYNYIKLASLYTVIFESNGGTEVSGIENVKEGEIIVEPTSPTKDGYTFEGWYLKNPELSDVMISDKWNFTTDVVEKDLILYAKWSKTNEPVSPTSPTPPELGQDEEVNTPNTGIFNSTIILSNIILISVISLVLLKKKKIFK